MESYTPAQLVFLRIHILFDTSKNLQLYIWVHFTGRHVNNMFFPSSASISERLNKTIISHMLEDSSAGGT